MLLKSPYILSLLLYILTVRSQQCRQGCKCSSKVIICEFTQINGYPHNLPTAITALKINGSERSPNSFGRLSSSAFSYSRMSHLILRYCGIDAIETGTFKTLPELKTLNLEYNKIHILSQQSFQGLTKLSTLELTGHRNCDIKPNAFKVLSTLLVLRLGEMDLVTLDFNLLKPLQNLVTLNLHGNKFRSIDWTVLLSLTNLKHIDLSGNQLITIPSKMSSLFTQIETKKGSINLGHNPWKCNWEIKWLKNTSASFSSEFSVGNIICDSPAHLQYISLISVPDKRLEPIIPKILYCNKTKVSVNKGSAVFINCSIKGDSTTVTWTNPTGTSFLSSSSQQNSHHVYVNGSLYIQSTSSSDCGNWTVLVSSQFGKDQTTVDVKVILSINMKTLTKTTHETITTTAPIRITTPMTATVNFPSKVLGIVTTDTTLKTPEKNSALQNTGSARYFVLVVCAAITYQRFIH